VADWEYRELKLPRGVSSGHAHDVVGIEGEFGGWELAQHVIFEGGRREVRLRRRLSSEWLGTSSS
jgi:hypothetical protein